MRNVKSADGLLSQRVHCHACGHSHDCADNAENTQCPHCGQPISFADIVISSHVSRKIDTRGNLRIEKKGDLFTPLTVCRDAAILGMVSGSLRCEGKITFYGEGNYPLKIDTNELLIPGGARVVCPFPIHARHVVVRGILDAPLLVEARLEVLRKGHVEGAVCARSIHVDRGGELRGQVRISPGPIPVSASHQETPQTSLRPIAGSRHQRHRPAYLEQKAKWEDGEGGVKN
jgi:cytoskeletal protein CcmA (bactofilin family)